MTVNKFSQSQDKDIELLNYIYQNAKMGSQNIAQLLPKIENNNLQSALLNQIAQYQGVANRASDLLVNLNVSPKECMIDKLSSKTGIALNTLTDTSTSHIAEMMITGSTMGVIDLTKKINQNKPCAQNVADLCDDLMKIEEENTQDMKRFL